MLDINNSVDQALTSLLKNKYVNSLSNVYDENDRVVGKFYLVYDENGKPYTAVLCNGVLYIQDVGQLKVVAEVIKDGPVYEFPTMRINVSKAKLIEIYKQLFRAWQEEMTNNLDEVF